VHPWLAKRNPDSGNRSDSESTEVASLACARPTSTRPAFAAKCRRLMIVVVLALAAALAVAAPAMAAPPETTTFAFHLSMVVDCGDFDAIFEEDIQIRRTTFFDNEGNAERLHDWIHVTGTVTHSETGDSFDDNAQFMFSSELPGPTGTSHGLFWSINVPGHGVVALAVGRLTRTGDPGDILFSAGQGHEELNQLGFAIVCDGLAGL
jgi:hypothetical protein